MECKESSAISTAASDASFNRNIVECKDFYDDMREWVNEVLIETLWNVKASPGCGSSITKRVLIETLWNVKLQTAAGMYVLWRGFNRNIVECKVRYIFRAEFVQVVLIETLWNVKLLI